MQEIIGGLSALGPVLEKLGVAGVLILALIYLWKENQRLKDELLKLYKERDSYRMSFERCKGTVQLLRQKAGLQIDLDVHEPEPEPPTL
jgi:hypothetical protein